MTETKLLRHFGKFSRHVLFWTTRTFGDIFLDGVNATQNFKRKIHSMWQIFGTKICCYCSFFSKRFGWICGLVLLYVKLPWNFPLRFKSLRDLCCLQPWQHSVYQLCWCVWDHLRTLLLVVIMAKVSNYSTKKNQDPPQQGLHPAEILKALKCKGLLVSFSSTTSIFRKLRLTLTGSVANLPWSGRPQKLSMEMNNVCGNSAK